jgi:hypothetical protein
MRARRDLINVGGTMAGNRNLVVVAEAARAARMSPDRVRRAFHSGLVEGEVVAGRILVDQAGVVALTQPAVKPPKPAA